MAFQHEGLACFVENEDERPFRFRVTVTDDELQIWVEDSKTKQQRQTTDLCMAAYVNHDNAISQAQPKDYAQCLRGKETTVSVRSLAMADKDGTRSLSLVLRASFPSRTLRLHYVFVLFPVALDRVELLAACVRELEEEIQRSKQRQEALITLRMNAAASPETALPWMVRDANDDGAIQLCEDGRTIELVRGGHYFVSLHLATSKATLYEVQVNGKRDRVLSDSCAEKHHQTMSFAVRVPANARLQILNKSKNECPNNCSLLTIVTL